MTMSIKTNWLMACWFMMVASNAFSSDGSEIGSIELHAMAHLTRCGSVLKISIAGKEPIIIASSGMDLSNYEIHNHFGVQEQFPIAIIVEDNELVFYHAAFIEHKYIGGRSILTIPLADKVPSLASLPPAIKRTKLVWSIDKNLKVSMDDSSVNLKSSDAQPSIRQQAQSKKKVKKTKPGKENKDD